MGQVRSRVKRTEHHPHPEVSRSMIVCSTHCFSCLLSNSSDLPADLFEEGEVKPTRPQKKKTANGTSKKRAATEVCDMSYRQ